MSKRKMIVAASLVCLVAAVAGGCNGNNKKAAQASKQAANHGVLDIPATPAPPPAPPVAYTPPAPPQPVIYDPPPAAAEQPVIEDSAVADASDSAPVPARAPSGRRASAAGTKYKVKKGESLWSIAQARYGNGNKWKAIAAANPRIDPNRVQAGQTIVLP